MTTKEILRSIGQFTDDQAKLFDEHIINRSLGKNDTLLCENEICSALYYIKSGAFFQYQNLETDANIIDLHLPGEWMFNQQSLTEQNPSSSTIKAFLKSEVLELSLRNLHDLMTKSQSFLQFGKFLNQSKIKSFMYDHSLNPTEKYNFIIGAKPELTKVFPVKMIASYLKIAPETLSRVRATV
ncbi:MAG: Crp/Fnr family transcriptional regulator [Bacteroidia bacterium]|nr:Crp/Fnr family transcriptional regulator [Bacteroidia bacterium]